MQEFAGDAADARPCTGGCSELEEKIQLLKLREFLGDAIGTFGEIRMVNCGFFWRGPAVRACVVGAWQIVPAKRGMRWRFLQENAIDFHLLVALRAGNQACAHRIKKSSCLIRAPADKKAGIDIGDPWGFALKEKIVVCGECLEFPWGYAAETDVDIAP